MSLNPGVRWFQLAVTLALVACGSTSRLAGRYLDEKDPEAYLELKSDGTLYLQTGPALGGLGLTGNYSVNGTEISLTFSNGVALRGSVAGDTLRFPESTMVKSNATGVSSLSEPSGKPVESQQNAPAAADEREFFAEGICSTVKRLATNATSPSRFAISLYPCDSTASPRALRWTAVNSERLYWDGGDTAAKGVAAVGESNPLPQWRRLGVWWDSSDSAPPLLANRKLQLHMLPRP